MAIKLSDLLVTGDSSAVRVILDTTRNAMQFYYGGQLATKWGNAEIEPAAPKQHAPRIEDLLRAFRFPLGRFILDGSTLEPIIRTNDRTRGNYMTLHGYPTELRGSPKEKIAAARKAMIDLLTHEVDEWLFMAGLVEDPHNVCNELDYADLNRMYEKGAAAL